MFQTTNQSITTCCSRSMGVYLHMTCWSISWSIIRTIPSLYLPHLCYVTFLWTNPSGRAFFCDTGRGLLGRSDLNLHGPSQNSLEQLGHSRFRHLRQYNWCPTKISYHPSKLWNGKQFQTRGRKKTLKPWFDIGSIIYSFWDISGPLLGPSGPVLVPFHTKPQGRRLARAVAQDRPERSLGQLKAIKVPKLDGQKSSKIAEAKCSSNIFKLQTNSHKLANGQPESVHLLPQNV